MNYSDSEKYAEKKNRGSCKNCHKSKKQKNRQTNKKLKKREKTTEQNKKEKFDITYVRHNVIAIICD